MSEFIHLIRTHPDLAQTIGMVGFCIYISTFFAVQTGRLCGNGMAFPVLQVTAAGCVLVSLASAYNQASFMIQTSYIVIGLFGIALRLARRRGRPGTAPTRPVTPSRAGVDRGRHETAMNSGQTATQSESPISPTLCPRL